MNIIKQWGRSAEERKAILDAPTAKIGRIEVRDLLGSARRVIIPNAATQQRIARPGARCDDVLAYEIIGDRIYEEDVVSVKNGAIVIKRPEELERRWLPSAALGIGGLGTRVGTAYMRPYPVLRAGLGIMPRWSWWPQRLGLELRGSLLYVEHDYVPLASDGKAKETETVPAWRAAIEAGPYYKFDGGWVLGGSAGLMLGSPIFAKDFTRAGAFQASLPPIAVYGRLPPIAQFVSFEALIRLMRERWYEHLTNFQGQSYSIPIDSWTFTAEFVARVGR